MVKLRKSRLRKDERITPTGVKRSYYRAFSTEEIEILGMNQSIAGATLKDFVRFVKLRFPEQHDPTYIGQWASRFSQGTEWQAGDAQSRRCLQKINKKKYPSRLNQFWLAGRYDDGIG